MNPELKKQMTEEAQRMQMPPAEPIAPEEPVLPVQPEEPVTPAPAEPVPEPAAQAVLEKKLNSIQHDLDELVELMEKQSEPKFDYYRIERRVDAAQVALEHKIAAIPNTADDTAELKTLMLQLLDQQNKNDQQLRQSLRETGNFQVQVRQRMQREMDEMREQQNGAQYNGLLKEISSMYADYHMVLKDEGMSPQTRKLLQALFAQMEDVLGDYDAEVCVSTIGKERPKNQCKVINKELTGDPTKHNTVIRSLKPGVKRDRLILQHEYVDIYVYDEALDPTLHPELLPQPETTEVPDTPAEEPTPAPVQEPVAEPAQEPTSEPEAEPVQEPAQEPAAEPAQEPAAEPAQEEAPQSDVQEEIKAIWNEMTGPSAPQETPPAGQPAASPSEPAPADKNRKWWSKW